MIIDPTLSTQNLKEETSYEDLNAGQTKKFVKWNKGNEDKVIKEILL